MTVIVPEICKNCKRTGVIEIIDENMIPHYLELCKYKDTIKELIQIADGDARLHTHCNFKEER